jgi:ATP-binding cassette, subfamily B, bacterial
VSTSSGAGRSRAHWRLLGRFLRPHRVVLGWLALLTLVTGSLPLAGPLLLGAMVDGAVEGATQQHLVRLAVALGAVGVVANGGSLLLTWLGARLAWTASNELRLDAARHAFSLGPSWFGRTTPGAAVDRIDGDATRLGELLAGAVVSSMAALVTLVGVVVLVGVQDWRLGLAFAVLLAVGAVVLVRLRDLTVAPGVTARARSGEVFGAAEERLRGAEELRTLGGARYAVDDLHRRSARTLAPFRRMTTFGMSLWSVTILIVVGGGLAVLAAGIVLQRAGAWSVGQVLVAFTATQLVRRPLEQVVGNLEQVQQAVTGAARLAELFDEVPAVAFTGERELPEGALSVVIEGARVRYPGAHDDALRGVDLRLAPAEHVGLVGASGGGKTTMTRLLHRALDPVEGTVTVGGVDLREIDERSLRRRVAVVTQQVQLLTASIRDNLTLFGTVDATDDELVATLRAVGLGPWFERLAGGLDARLGDDVGTSAGEAQLVALARVLLRDPGLVVLDEPTARLDTVSALAVTRALEVLLEGRTAVVVAHRLATLDRVDRVAVVRDGRIVEEGDPALLRTHGSWYADLLAAEEGALHGG